MYSSVCLCVYKCMLCNSSPTYICVTTNIIKTQNYSITRNIPLAALFPILYPANIHTVFKMQLNYHCFRNLPWCPQVLIFLVFPELPAWTVSKTLTTCVLVTVKTCILPIRLTENSLKPECIFLNNIYRMSAYWNNKICQRCLWQSYLVQILI